VSTFNVSDNVCKNYMSKNGCNNVAKYKIVIHPNGPSIGITRRLICL